MADTSLTLLDRLRRPDQPDAWDRFARLYAPLLLEWARARGLQSADAEDLVQTVLVKLIRRLPTYERRDGQTFRGWLFTVCRNECHNFRTRPATRPVPGTDDPLATVLSPAAGDDPDEAEYRRALLHRALAVVRADFSPAVWAAFTRCALDGAPADRVAAELGVTANAVYLARNRVLTRVRSELAGLLD
ncbi:RNA polymerase sigma factor [Frigoriglobus tundricola]|nr:sigma-70 family RNA polymerase sigma factor [Frigoriglobus tundricola]